MECEPLQHGWRFVPFRKQIPIVHITIPSALSERIMTQTHTRMCLHGNATKVGRLVGWLSTRMTFRPQPTKGGNNICFSVYRRQMGRAVRTNTSCDIIINANRAQSSERRALNVLVKFRFMSMVKRTSNMHFQLWATAIKAASGCCTRGAYVDCVYSSTSKSVCLCGWFVWMLNDTYGNRGHSLVSFAPCFICMQMPFLFAHGDVSDCEAAEKGIRCDDMQINCSRCT